MPNQADSPLIGGELTEKKFHWDSQKNSSNQETWTWFGDALTCDIFFPPPGGADLSEGVQSYFKELLEGRAAKEERNLCFAWVFESLPYLVAFRFKERQFHVLQGEVSDMAFALECWEKCQQTRPTKAEEKMADWFAQMVRWWQEDDTSRWELTVLLGQGRGQSYLEKYPVEPFQERFEGQLNKLLEEIKAYPIPLLERVTDFYLNLSAKYSLLRIHLLKFLAILPTLDFDQKGTEVKRLALEAMRRLIEDSQKAKRLGLSGEKSAVPDSLFWPLVVKYKLFKYLPEKFLLSSIRRGVSLMAKRFIAGTDIGDAQRSLNQLRRSGREATLDPLGELVVSQAEANQYLQKVLSIIAGLAQQIPKGEKNGANLPSAHISIKLSALTPDFNPLAFEQTHQSVFPALVKILKTAARSEVFVNVDAEHYEYRDLSFKILVKTLKEEVGLINYPWVGLVVQAYLVDAQEHLEQIISFAQTRSVPFPVRLVKGAYWDAEVVEAKAHNYQPPVFLNKSESDLNLRQLAVRILEVSPHLQLCLGSHNIADHCFIRSIQEHHFPQSLPIEHQCLHMTYEALSQAMVKMGWPVRNYVPIGNLLVGMAYLVRRIMENSSQVGFLQLMRTHRQQRTFEAPELFLKRLKAPRGKSISFDSDFRPIKPWRSEVEKEVLCWEEAQRKFLKEQLGQDYHNPAINAVTEDRGESLDWVVVTSPSDPKQCVGRIQWMRREHGDQAVEVAYSFAQEGNWAKSAPQLRANLLLKVARLMLNQRLNLATLIMYEAGKNVKEAFADVDEAIDFLHFYARSEVELQTQHNSEGAYRARGVVVCISPWNFPLAIPCGMVSAALVAGNSVILKSAEQSPLVAQEMVDLFLQAGLDPKALIHLPGAGEEVGDQLVRSQKVSMVAFTGSKAVGVKIGELVGQRILTNPVTQKPLNAKVITEMGGKNAVIVTSNAELDETVSGCLYSAFAHAGQKCSALSRLIVDNKIKDKFLQRFTAATSDMVVGVAHHKATTVNPLITAEEQQRVRQQVLEAIKEAESVGGKVWLDLSHQPYPGNCVGPVIIELPYSVVLDQDTYASQELFAPVVHCIGYDTLEQSLMLFNSTPYGLTGGIYAQSQDDIDSLSASAEVGNLYINRPCTGARVGIEPFGGFKFSGTGPKAGHRQYLKAFHVWMEKRGERAAGQPLLEKSLQDFAHWMIENREDYLWSPHPNVSIPGQLSFCDHSLLRKRGVLVTFTAHPNQAILQYFVAALGLGVDLEIWAQNEPSYNAWSQLVIYWKKILNFQRPIRIHKGPWGSGEQNSWESYLYEDFQILLIAGESDQVQGILKEAYGGPWNRQLIRVITSFDAPPLEMYPDYLWPFVYERAYAINTMRHGAPMEIEL